MKKYEAYKDSGVEWIGEIPEHWQVKRLKYIKSEAKNSFVDGPFGSNLKTDHFIENGDVYVIDSGFITSGFFEFKRGFKTISNEHFETVRRSECTKNDIIISKIGANFGMSGILPELDKPSLVSGNTLKLTVNTREYNLRLIHLQLLNLKQYGEIDLLVKGSAQPALSMGAMSDLPFVISKDLKEQELIINYLDHKTSQLDTLIRKKEKLIELLQEERTAIINHAVTKGLNPNAPMRDSGIEWLGEIPKHWEVKKLKYLLNIQSGKGISNEELDPEGKYPVYGGNGILGYTDKFSSEGEDLIIGRVGALCGNVHLIKGSKWISDNALHATTNQYSNFLFFSLKQLDLNRLANKNAQPLITGTMVKDQTIALPSLDEQKIIVIWIINEHSRVDLIISKTQQEIELLKEYKIALISEVVTGKADVRNERLN